MLQNLRKDKDLTYSELARRLEGYGVRISTQVLINKLNRGTFTFSFALQVLVAMGETSLRLPSLPASLSKRSSKHPEILDEA